MEKKGSERGSDYLPPPGQLYSQFLVRTWQTIASHEARPGTGPGICAECFEEHVSLVCMGDSAVLPHKASVLVPSPLGHHRSPLYHWGVGDLNNFFVQKINS